VTLICNIDDFAMNVTSSYDYVAGCIHYSGCCCFLGPEKMSETFSLMIANFPRSTMFGEIVLPEKILIQILSYLDFKTVQKICTLVSKSWLELIRSSKFSGRGKFAESLKTYKSLKKIVISSGIALYEHEKSLRSDLTYSSKISRDLGE
jgi:hypothetical protein